MVISDQLYNREYKNLQDRFHSSTFGSTITLTILYALSSGTSHSAQWALTAMLKAANEGTFDFVGEVKGIWGESKSDEKTLP